MGTFRLLRVKFGLIRGKSGFLRGKFVLFWGVSAQEDFCELVNVAYYGSVSATCQYPRCSFGLLVGYGNRLNSFQTDFK